MRNPFRITFDYNAKGFGDLVLRYKDDILGVWFARTGSIAKKGSGFYLKNAIDPKTWYLCRTPEVPHHTEEHRMFIKDMPGHAWKWRLWRYPVPQDHEITSGYLIHPDGGVPGTLGCIGIQKDNGMGIYHFAHMIFDVEKRPVVECIINFTGGAI